MAHKAKMKSGKKAIMGKKCGTFDKTICDYRKTSRKRSSK